MVGSEVCSTHLRSHQKKVVGPQPSTVLAIAVALAFFMPCHLLGQCESFRLGEYQITALHCEPESPVLTFPQFDVAASRAKPNARSLQLGSGQPKYFLTRRGFRVELKTIKVEQFQTLVDQEFFQGESGSPVFDKDDRVCGVVLGNRIESKTFGRVANLASAFANVGVLPTPLGPTRRRSSNKPADDHSSSESANAD